ncbi:MAG: tRNA (N(6)-L-threonylcarbamoyladenosine(37)-C(2))-methylthiotransferase MtaB, partial [Candidatus Omnitrophota bacterium]
MKVKFITLGCKVNQYETQSLREIFLANGFKETFTKADFYFINTCSVTHSADRKSIKYIRKAKKENPQAKILVTGCLAEKDKELIEKEGVDYIVSQNQKYKIPSILNLKNKLSLKDNLSLRITDFYLNRAFVKIQDGCNNFCSFCKVRLIRGKSKSRPVEEIVREVKFLLERGFKEIVLCGINLG